MTGTLTERLTSDWAARIASGLVFPTYFQEWPEHGEPLLAGSWCRPTSWVKFVLPISEEEMSWRSTEIVFPEITDELVPRTRLGRQLASLRNKAIRIGMKLLSADEVLEEVKRRRGELQDDEKNLY